MKFQTLPQATAAFRADVPNLAKYGIYFAEGTRGYLPEEFKHNFGAVQMAMDAQPALSTQINSGVPAFLTNWVDPDAVQIVFAPNEMADIFGEEKKGDWTTQTAFFPVVEHTGEVTSYGDYNENGSSGANVNWPQRQSYLFQSFIEYGELELARMGTAKLSWASEQQQACALAMNKYSDLTYAYGLANLQTYGALNDPNLPTFFAPAPKAYGGSKWINGGVVVATANEIFTDIQTLFTGLVNQSQGAGINAKSKMALALAPQVATALTTTNAFDVNVEDLLKKNFPNLEVKTSIRYAEQSTQNPQGLAGGNLVQLIAASVEGQKTATTAFNEKMRYHKMIIGASSYRQKVTGGTWGTIIKQPFAIASMQGV